MYPDLRVPDAEDISFGSIRQGSLCLDTLGHLSDGLIGVYSCHGAGGNQDWSFTKNGHIKHGSDLCVALEAPRPSANLRLRLCSNSPLQVIIIKRSLQYFKKRYVVSKIEINIEKRPKTTSSLFSWVIDYWPEQEVEQLCVFGSLWSQNNHYVLLLLHSSEIRYLCLMK